MHVADGGYVNESIGPKARKLRGPRDDKTKKGTAEAVP